jgi:hypothetical protein
VRPFHFISFHFIFPCFVIMSITYDLDAMNLILSFLIYRFICLLFSVSSFLFSFSFFLFPFFFFLFPFPFPFSFSFSFSFFLFPFSFSFFRSIYKMLVKSILFFFNFHSICTFNEILSDIHESDLFLIHLQFLEIYLMSYWNQYMANHRHRNIAWK